MFEFTYITDSVLETTSLYYRYRITKISDLTGMLLDTGKYSAWIKVPTITKTTTEIAALVAQPS